MYRLPLYSVAALVFALALPGLAPLPAQANSLPSAANDSVETHARQPVLIDLLANDGDADGDPLAVTVTGSPSFGTISDHGDGTVTYTPDPALFEGSGGDSFSYSISDGVSGSAGAMVSIAEVAVPSQKQPIIPTVLCEDDFSSDLSNWTFLDFGTLEGPSNWVIQNGELAQTSNIRDDGLQKGTYAVYSAGAGSTWTDYRVRALIRPHDDDHIGILFRYQDDQNHYRFIASHQGSYRRLEKLVANQITILADEAVGHESQDAWFVEIDVEGNQIELRIDGELVFSVTDSSFSSGTVGFLAHAMQSGYYDDLRVTQLPEADPPLLFEDRFDDAGLEGWTTADSGRLSFPSNWQVSGGELSDSSNIYSSIFVGGPGTIALVDAGGHWTDYRFRLQLRATDDDSVIVLFRYQDWQNHYAFHWNAQSNYHSLRRAVDGQFVDLVSHAGGYVQNRTYFVEIVAEGDLLEVWIDGHRVLQAVDDTFPGGTAGLASAAMDAISFDNVKATAIP